MTMGLGIVILLVTVVMAGLTQLDVVLSKRAHLFPWNTAVTPNRWLVWGFIFVMMESFALSLVACYVLT